MLDTTVVEPSCEVEARVLGTIPLELPPGDELSRKLFRFEAEVHPPSLEVLPGIIDPEVLVSTSDVRLAVSLLPRLLDWLDDDTTMLEDVPRESSLLDRETSIEFEELDSSCDTIWEDCDPGAWVVVIIGVVTWFGEVTALELATVEVSGGEAKAVEKLEVVELAKLLLNDAVCCVAVELRLGRLELVLMLDVCCAVDEAEKLLLDDETEEPLLVLVLVLPLLVLVLVLPLLVLVVLVLVVLVVLLDRDELLDGGELLLLVDDEISELLLEWLGKDELNWVVTVLELAVVDEDIPVLEGRELPPLPTCAEVAKEVVVKDEEVVVVFVDVLDAAAAAAADELDRKLQYDADEVRQVQALEI
ncbi:hypothetical protein J7T55_015516 [Diaporthe amygdali]|uniref:uncharacterized protein n=1 Tax=Phomopsis amygdali TaxID=1214568 RepID=UPI0022FDDE21|nr:uncharacterized protein J7T55_015516 [Diaporthe amygdali]KAJ0120782.1 hypothetical protein J7T55_015516 [Diaporthe amygdali]